jgi:hypothetical protein
VEDLLPGAENKLAVTDRHGEGGPEHCGLQVRMTVSVVPCLLVPVVTTSGSRSDDLRHDAWARAL